MASRGGHSQSVDYAALTQVVRELVEVMRRAGLFRLEVAHGDLRILLEAEPAGPPVSGVATSGPLPLASLPATQEVSDEADTFTIDAPMVGTFYSAPAPGADPFVQEGDRVEPGQTVAIIEAMKIMNEIVAERPGEVVAILVANGQPVEYGQPLIQFRAVDG